MNFSHFSPIKLQEQAIDIHCNRLSEPQLLSSARWIRKSSPAGVYPLYWDQCKDQCLLKSAPRPIPHPFSAVYTRRYFRFVPYARSRALFCSDRLLSTVAARVFYRAIGVFQIWYLIRPFESRSLNGDCFVLIASSTESFAERILQRESIYTCQSLGRCKL